MLISSEEQLRNVVAELAQRPAVGLDLETTGLRPFEGDQMCMASLHHPDVGTYAVPFRMSGFITNVPEKAIKLLQPLVDNCELVGHNVGPFDCNFLYAEGIDISKVRVWDTLTGAILWNDSMPRFGLEPLCVSLLGSDPWKEGSIITPDASQTPPELLVPRAERDAVETWQLREHLEPKILARGDPYPELLRRDMRWALFQGYLGRVGVGFDEDLAKRILRYARHRAYTMEQEMWKRWRPGLKLNSWQQLLKFFQGKHGITLPNTEDWVMKMAVRGNKDAEADVHRVLEYRKWDKEANTWLEPWLRSFRKGGGRIRGGWGLDASKFAGRASGMTRTLRLRCSDPNLMAVPHDERIPYHNLRCTFVAGEGLTFVGYDDSQAEVRFAAHYSKEEKMLEILRDPDGDIHQMVADDLKIDRYPAKQIVLSSQYNIGRSHLAEKLTQETLEPVDEADTDRWLRRYHRRYPRLRAVSQRAEHLIQERGYLLLWNDRRVHFNPEVDLPHKAFNLLIQMGVAELLKSQVFELQDFCEDHGLRTRVVLPVHDEIITEVPPEEMEFVPDIKRRMEQIGEWRCPLIVNTWSRKRWSNKIPEEVQ
jgi:DNA polymerase-1